jgi:hypothetical protein
MNDQHQLINSPNMYRGINQTVPNLLRANMPVSYSQLRAELRSLGRAIDYHYGQYLSQLIELMKADSVSDLAMIPAPRHIVRLEQEWNMVLKAIKSRRVGAILAVADAIRRSNRAYTDIPGSSPREA